MTWAVVVFMAAIALNELTACRHATVVWILATLVMGFLIARSEK